MSKTIDAVVAAGVAIMAEASKGVHRFERAGLGKAPFKCIGYRESKYQAAPGAPIQPGTSCDYCGTSIMHVFIVKGSDERPAFKVGCDCVAKVGDAGLLRAVKRARKTEEQRKAAEEAKRARDERAQTRAAEVAARVEAAAPTLAKLDAMAAGSHVWRRDTSKDMAARIRDGMPISEKMAALIDRMWAEHSAPKKETSYVGEVGKMWEGEVTISRIVYIGAFGVEGTYTFNHMQRWHFVDASGNELVWKTSVNPYRVLGHEEQSEISPGQKYNIPEGTKVKIRAKIKAHDLYREEKQTVLERAKIEIVSMPHGPFQQ